MYVKEKVNTFFLNLIEDKDLAMACFYDKDISEYNIDKLNELQDNIRKAKKTYSKMTLLLPLMCVFKEENVANIASKVERENHYLAHCIHELNIFESKLAFLIVSGNIDIERAKKLGFSGEYINELLSRFKMQALHPYNEYYHDERSGRTSILTEDGHMRILSYTPSAVRKNLRKRKKQDALKRWL